ncbi:response regulator transcription factor [Streptomyces sp. NPDC089919]|uniref:response regulator transcription factor n=1 Tax=Streptomyces sp. NPDC089919 TaxID=3155188 RepID=UPI003445EC41
MIRVVIVDDEPLMRAGLRHALDDAADLSVAAAVPVREAVTAIGELRPRVVLLDSCTDDAGPLSEGLGALPEPPRVCVVSRSADEQYVALALASGAAGYVLKSTPADQLPPLVRFLAAGWTMTSASVSDRLARRYLADLQRETASGVLERLTPREREVLAHLRRGLPNAAIARRMHLAHGTVKDHVSAILAKLQVATRLEAALIADRAASIGPSEIW